MTSAAVFARANGKELFLGHSRATSSRAEAHLMDLIARLSGKRAELWGTLQARGEIRIASIDVADPHEDLSEANRYVHPDTGEPFLRQYPLGPLPFTTSAGADTVLPMAYWERLIFTDSTGRRDDIALTADYKVPFTLEDGSESDLDLL